MASRILVVEDSPTQAQMAKLILEGEGYQVEIARNGEEGLKKAVENPPDLIIADIMMPVMDGYEMTRRIKSNPRLSGLPVVIITSKDQPEDIVRGLEVGADHFFTKPYRGDELISSISNLFDRMEKVRKGESGEQKAVERLEKEILITKNREQILKTLLLATSRIVDCDLMTLLTTHDGEVQLFLISFHPVKDGLLEDIVKGIMDFLRRIKKDLPYPESSRVIKIIANRDKEVLSPGALRSYLHVPLILDGQVTGLLSVYSQKEGAFGTDDIRFLFDIGTRVASALSKIRAKG